MNELNQSKLYLAILEVQKKVSVLKKDEKNPFFRSQYLSLAGLIEALQPVLVENGLVVMQHPLKPGELETMIVHAESSQMVKSTLVLPLGDDKQTPQGAGSAISYARRYALMSIFNIAAEDDDGNKSSGYTAPKATKTYTVPTDTKCSKCDAPMTISKSTGKPYCSKLCWKKPQPAQDEGFPAIEDSAF